MVSRLCPGPRPGSEAFLLKNKHVLTPVFSLALTSLLTLAACAPRTGPVQQAPVRFSRAAVETSARKSGLNAAFYYAMDDYNGGTLRGAKYLHWQLAQVKSNSRLRLFLSADSDEKNDGIWSRVHHQQAWMGQGFEQRGELDTGRTPALRDFLSWMSRETPAKNTFVTLSSHGGGYRGIMYDYDGTVNGPHENLSLKQTFKALGKGFQGGRLDGLHLAACMMATIEVADALKSVTQVLSASEDFSFGGSTPWEYILDQHHSTQNMERLIHDTVQTPFTRGAFAKQDLSQTWSAIRLNQDFERLVKSVDRLAKALIVAMPTESQSIRQATKATSMFAAMQRWSADYGDYYQRDLVDFCEQLLRHSQNPHIREDAQAVIAGVKKIVVSEAHTPDQTMAHGLAIYLPVNGNMDPAYRDSLFARRTRWDEFLALL